MIKYPIYPPAYRLPAVGQAVCVRVYDLPPRWGIVTAIRGELATVRLVLSVRRGGDAPYSRLANSTGRFHMHFVEPLREYR